MTRVAAVTAAASTMTGRFNRSDFKNSSFALYVLIPTHFRRPKILRSCPGRACYSCHKNTCNYQSSRRTAPVANRNRDTTFHDGHGLPSLLTILGQQAVALILLSCPISPLLIHPKVARSACHDSFHPCNHSQIAIVCHEYRAEILAINKVDIVWRMTKVQILGL